MIHSTDLLAISSTNCKMNTCDRKYVEKTFHLHDKNECYQTNALLFLVAPTHTSYLKQNQPATPYFTVQWNKVVSCKCFPVIAANDSSQLVGFFLF